RILLQGIFVGAITGLIGAGGGFLIIPALVGGLKMPMKQAIGTSLVIIAINAAFGFLSSLANNAVDWQLLLRITLIAMVGVFIGTQISQKLDG
ncbi:sulfite exporter TauE/SafE family protein, partial [Clostridium perfringens]